MKVAFAGVRGSTPAPGVEFAGVGGNTSCVAISPERSDRPRLILDAGTGIRSVTGMLGEAAFRGTILLSHLHWDHVQGLPFFTAADRDDSHVHLLLPDDGEGAEQVLGRAMSPPHFPIAPDGLRGEWTFGTIDEGTVELEGLAVTAREIPHKGGRTFGYRVTERDRSLAYLPDHLPALEGPGREAALELARGADLLVHDAQFVEAERATAELFGHATVAQAVALAEDAGARELVLFHHSPTRTDDQLRRLLTTVSSPVIVTIAAEGDDRWLA